MEIQFRSTSADKSESPGITSESTAGLPAPVTQRRFLFRGCRKTSARLRYQAIKAFKMSASIVLK